jgi:hypothetical protein
MHPSTNLEKYSTKGRLDPLRTMSAKKNPPALLAAPVDL